MYNQKIEKYVENLFKNKKKKKDLEDFTCHNYSHLSPKTKNEFCQIRNVLSKTVLDSLSVYTYKEQVTIITITKSSSSKFLGYVSISRLFIFTRKSFDFLRVYKTCEFKV